MSTSSPALTVRPAVECDYDVVALGEVMLRLDPGERRIRTARTFSAWEGGGEYNVARGLRRCFGLRGAVVTALADNEIGRLVEDFMLTGGLDTSHVRWVPYDGIGREVRNGLNFTERGFGVRGAVGVSDRGNTAVAQMRPDDVDWDALFARGVRWFHTGGIFAALSENAADVAEAAMSAARKHGTIVSYDLNYRPSLWQGIGGVERAQDVNRRLAQYVDVMIGNEEDFTASLGFEVEGVDESLTDLDTGAFRSMIGRAAEAFPNFQVIATTLRGVHTATVNDWGAIAWSRTQGFAEATHRPRLEILDRVGGGDSFASGLAYGLMELGSIGEAVEYGAAHGALAMTTPGDTSTATLAEVAKLAGGGSARVQR
ncbi:2-dehydro-3-deoxygluconokinase [Paraoerskovia marina]|uniref:2-dehydro-3-deoxygluconokinase n=1 Tax=Paraoerskovia marina TaxID=545619 RepID=A0A1H1UUA9_9CELL|nr:sugar kinase [Paraoerskovia marina]SDS75900.1 2-dehydro-3-deoxygluconokinase [Paraoerskovia marina]